MITYPTNNSRKESVAILNELERRAKKRGIPKPFFEWVNDYWYSRGKHLDFIKRPYLNVIYQDQHPFIVYSKSAQVGLSERLLTESLWLSDSYKENAIYFFPTAGSVSDFVQERIDEPINNSIYLSEISGRAKIILGKHADKIGLKRMSNGFTYFRGAQSPAQITSVSADAIFVDELDRIDIQNVPYLDKRLQGSARKWQRWGSTPTYANVGIDKMYRLSDMHEYNIKCNHCNEWQPLDFLINIDKERKEIICKKCRKQIIPWALEGMWIDKNGTPWSIDKKSDIRGFHISQLYSPTFDVAKAVNESNKFSEWEMQQFYNQVLGLPYEPKGDKITGVDIDACKGDYNMPDMSSNRIFGGCDVGKRLHYVLRDNDNRIVAAGSVTDFFGAVNSLEAIHKQFNVSGWVIDALPETRKVSEFVTAFKGRVKMCYYTGLTEIKSGEKYWNVDGDKVNTNRTVSLDNMVAEFKKRTIKIPKNHDIEPEFTAHLQAPVRVINEDTKGNKKAEYIEAGEDHLFHSNNYAKLAANIFNVATPEVFIM